MAKPKSPKVLCVPVNSERAGKSARSALTGARNAAQGYKRMKRKQLNKARGQLAKQGGLSVQSQQSLKFRRDKNITGPGLTTPFKMINANVLNTGFETTSATDAFDDTFIKELFGAKREADFVFYSRKSDATFEFATNPRKPSGLNLSGRIGGVDDRTDDGCWLVYLGLNSDRVLPGFIMLGVRFGDAPADIQRAVTNGFDLKKLVDRGPVRVHFSDRGLNQLILLTEKNHWVVFNISSGVASVDPTRINVTRTIPAELVTEASFTAKPVAERPYGPDFNAIRPPGSVKDVAYAELAENVSSRDVVNFYNKMLRESWVAIRDSLAGPDLDKFLAHYPKSNSLSLPRGAFDTSSTALWLNVAAVANSIYEVAPVSYDVRPDDQGDPPSSTLDPGPYNEKRGLLEDGTALVKGPRRPKGKKFDNRVGSLVILHTDELDEITLEPVGIGPLANRSNNKNDWPEALVKLEHIVRLRVKYAKQLMYGPYNDYATVAALFRVGLGQKLFDGYVDDPATMLNTLTSTNVNANIPNNIFKETWGVLAIRVVMGSRYSEVGDLPNYAGTDQPPENADRLLPFKAPSQSDKLVAYSDIYDVDVNGAEIRNYARPDVHGFDFGSRALFRSVPAKRIVIHWGGTQTGYLVGDGGAIAAMLSDTRHSPSTHFTINHEGTIINQHAELAATTGHAYGFNFDSAGVDIPNIGAILRAYKSSVTTGYVNIGYTVINAPFYNSALGKMLISPMNQYETMYQLIVKLCALRNPPANIHTDQLQFDPKPVGLYDDNGKPAVLVSSLVGGKDSQKFTDFQSVGGVMAHLHVATNGKTDGIDGYIYYTLRHQFQDDSVDAYRRMKLTLQGDVKHTPDGIRYLILDRS